MGRRVVVTLGILAIYRLGISVPIPGVDREVWANIVQGWDRSILEVFNILTGGGFEGASVCALGTIPLGIAVGVAVAVERRRAWWPILCGSMLGGVLLALVFEYHHVAAPGDELVAQPGWWFRLQTGVVVTAGTALVVACIDQIGRRGVGSGGFIVIAANVAAGVPGAVTRLSAQQASSTLSAIALVVAAIVVLVLSVVIVFFENACRYVPLEYPDGGAGELPFHLNMEIHYPAAAAAFTLAILFALAAGVETFEWVPELTVALEGGGWLYNVLFAGCTVFWGLVYVAIDIDPEEIASNLEESGAVIPEVEPGRETAAFIDRLLVRLTVVAGMYMSVVCLVPFILQRMWGVTLGFGGVSLVVVVCIARETMLDWESDSGVE